MNKTYHARSTETEQAHLADLIAPGMVAARKLLRACILLKADKGPGSPA